MQPVDLPAGELLLRPWRDDDLDELTAALREAEVRRWNDPASFTRDDVRAVPARRRNWSAGTRAASASTDLQRDRIVLVHAVEDVASGRVAAKAGFTLEGPLRRSHRYGDGAEHDELLWSRLSDDP